MQIKLVHGPFDGLVPSCSDVHSSIPEQISFGKNGEALSVLGPGRCVLPSLGWHVQEFRGLPSSERVFHFALYRAAGRVSDEGFPVFELEQVVQ